MRLAYPRFNAAASFAAAIALLVASSRAHAGSGFVETGFGMGNIANTGPLLLEGGPATTSMGLSMNIGVFASVFGNATEIQLGVVNKMVNASGEGRSFVLNVPYPELRIQLSRLFVGVGYSPYVMGSASSSLQDLQQAQGASALALDGGILFPIVPIFSMGAYGSMVKVTGGGANPPSAKEFGVLLRFYFTVTGNQGGSSNEYKGWRYPFGREIW